MIHAATMMNSQVPRQNCCIDCRPRRSLPSAHVTPAAWIITQSAIRQPAVSKLVIIERDLE